MTLLFWWEFFHQQLGRFALLCHSASAFWNCNTLQSTGKQAAPGAPGGRIAKIWGFGALVGGSCNKGEHRSKVSGILGDCPHRWIVFKTRQLTYHCLFPFRYDLKEGSSGQHAQCGTCLVSHAQSWTCCVGFQATCAVRYGLLVCAEEAQDSLGEAVICCRHTDKFSVFYVLWVYCLVAAWSQVLGLVMLGLGIQQENKNGTWPCKPLLGKFAYFHKGH